MTDKRSVRKQTTTEQQHDIKENNWTLDYDCAHVNETPIDYLSHTDTTSLIKKAVYTLLQNRPDDPLQFLIDYFAPVQSNTVDAAYEKLSWTHYSAPVYQRNVLEVYDVLVTSKNDDTSLKGLLGTRFNCLLERISNDLPDGYSQYILEKVQTRTNLVISFNRFYHDILLLHVMKDFLQVVQDIYKDLDVHATGKASFELCKLVVDNLFVSVNQTNASITNELARNVQNLSMKDRRNTLDKEFVKLFFKSADTALMNDMDTMSEDEFIEACVLAFLENV